LVRFDGVRFTVFDRGNSPGLGADSGVQLREDAASQTPVRKSSARAFADVSWTPIPFSASGFSPARLAFGEPRRTFGFIR